MKIFKVFFFWNFRKSGQVYSLALIIASIFSASLAKRTIPLARRSTAHGSVECSHRYLASVKFIFEMGLKLTRQTANLIKLKFSQCEDLSVRHCLWKFQNSSSTDFWDFQSFLQCNPRLINFTIGLGLISVALGSEYCSRVLAKLLQQFWRNGQQITAH